MDTELEYINTAMLAERELMYRRVEQAIQDFRDHSAKDELTLKRSEKLCEDCKQPYWKCALRWLHGDECFIICDLMGIDHSAMLTAIGATNGID